MAHAPPAAGGTGTATAVAPSPALSLTLSERARMAATHNTRSPTQFHPMPVIGYPASFYDKHVKQAEAAGDRHAKAAHKVGQYVTAALDPQMSWDEKLRRYCHALERYCKPPENADEGLTSFYHKLGDVVRRHAGQEAMHSARQHHQEYLKRLKAGEPREAIEEDAEAYFFDLLGHAQCPNWCSRDAWNQITEWRDYWV